MKTLLTTLLLSALALGQSATSIPIVINQNGTPLANVLVTVCNTNPGTGVCNSLAALYTDQTLSHACTGSGALLNNLTNPSAGSGCSNPGFTDGLGNVVAFSAPGLFWCQYAQSGIVGGTAQPCPFSASGNVPQFSVESFGAVGDWNGTTGTDNTAAINACFNQVLGACVLQAKAYKITGPLTITRGGVGLIGSSPGYNIPSWFPSTPSVSQIVSTCASCDILDVAGVSAGNMIAYPIFRNFTLARSVTPTGTAKGLSLVFVAGPVVDGVTVLDSMIGVYMRGMNNPSKTLIQNSFVNWGSTGIGAPTGTVVGWEVDSTGGITSNSMYLQNTGVVPSFGHQGGLTEIGYFLTGSQVNDFFCYQCNASLTDIGYDINSTNAGFGNSQDIHFLNGIVDGQTTNAVLVNGVSGSVSITGGWFNMNTATCGASPVMDFETSGNISVVGATLHWGTCTGGGILSHLGNSVKLNGNQFVGLNSSTAITVNQTSNGVIDGNDLGGITATNGISLIGADHFTVGMNTISGSLTNGIILDSGTHFVTGLESNTCGGSGGTVTTCINDSGGNSVLRSVNLLCSSTAPTFGSGFNSGSIPVGANGTCAFNVVIGTGAAGSTGVINLPTAANGWSCSATNQNRADVVSQTGNTTTSSTLTNFGTTFTATNWTNSDSLLVTCLGR